MDIIWLRNEVSASINKWKKNNSNLHMHINSLIKQRARKQGMHFQFKSLKMMKKYYYRDETPWNKMYCQCLIQISLPKLKIQIQHTCRKSKCDQNKRCKNIEVIKGICCFWNLVLFFFMKMSQALQCTLEMIKTS